MGKLTKQKYEQERKAILKKIEAAKQRCIDAELSGNRIDYGLGTKLLVMYEAQLDVLDTEQGIEGDWPKLFEITVYKEWDDGACQLADELGYAEYDDEYANIANAAYEVDLVFSVDAEGKVSLVGAWSDDDGVGRKVSE